MIHKSYWSVCCWYGGFDVDYDYELDDLVGRENCGSDCGFGERDLEWSFIQKTAALRAGKKLKRKKRVTRVELSHYIWDKKTKNHEVNEDFILKGN